MLYIHIPFCEKKCAYCDFLSFKSNDEEIEAYINSLNIELVQKAALLKNHSPKYEISSIFIGGGTPSILNAKYIYKIFDELNKNFSIMPDAEISIESNPNSLTYEKALSYIENGINRISIGLQSANDEELKTLGRIHNYNQFVNSYDEAIKAGFHNINIDLIKNIPNQTSASFKNTLDKVLSLNPTHLSIYDLIIEEGTKFYELYNNNELPLPSEEEQGKIDEVLYSTLKDNNYIRYEISNYAKAGKICRHNLGYWSDIPYLGIGLAASSYFENRRYKNNINIKNYISFWKSYNNQYDNLYDLLSNTSIENNIKDLSPKEIEQNLMNEYMMLSMRTIYGARKNYFHKKFGRTIESIYGKVLKSYSDYIIEDDESFHFTDKGFDISNQILSSIIL